MKEKNMNKERKSPIKDFFYDLSVKWHQTPFMQKREEKKKDIKNDLFQRRVFIVLMMSVAVAHFLVFWVYVNFDSIVMAFQVQTSSGVKWTLENFERFFRELKIPEFELALAVKNTLLFFVMGSFIILPISIVFAYLLFKKVWGSYVFRVIFFLPSIISSVVLVTLFKYIVASDGPVNYILSLFAGKPVTTSWVTERAYSMRTILTYCIWTGFGSNIVLLTGAIYRIPQDVLEYCRLDGVGIFRELFTMIIPMIWPTLSTLLVFDTAGLFTHMGPILPFTEGQFGTSTIGYFIFDKVNLGQYEYPAAIGLVFTVIGLPLVLIVKKLLGKVYEDVEY